MAGLQKKVVVIDIGYRYTKLGISGETHPRCIIPSKYRDPVTGLMKNVLSFKKEEELYGNFVEFLHYLYFKKILISPKDTKVIVVESLLSNINIRETLAKVLFCHLQIASLLMVPSHVVSIYTLGIPSALVLDIGYSEASVIPVYEGFAVVHAYEAQPLASQLVETNLKNLLMDYYKEKDDNSMVALIEDLPDQTLEDIKVRLCFVTSLDRSLKIEANEEIKYPPCVDYNVSGTNVLKVDGKIRETACEVLFRLDADEISLTSMLLNSLLKCPLDMRRVLSENILLVGGTSSMPGIKSRILSELRHYVKSPKYKDKLFVNNFKMHSSPTRENYTAWLGGSLIGVTEMINLHSVTKDDYKREKDIPDWANLKYNTRSVDK